LAMSVMPLSLKKRIRSPEDQVHGDDREREGEVGGEAVGVPHEDDGRGDGARAGEQRGAERDERDVDVLDLAGLRGVPAGEQVERDEQEEETAGALDGRDADAEVGQDRLAADRKQADHAEGDEDGLARGGHPRRARLAPDQAQEHRHGAGWIHDHDERDGRLGEKPHVKQHRASLPRRHPHRRTAAPWSSMPARLSTAPPCRPARQPTRRGPDELHRPLRRPTQHEPSEPTRPLR